MKWKIEKELKYRVAPGEEVALEVLKIKKEELLRIIAYFFINLRVDQNYMEVIVKSGVGEMFGIENGVLDSIMGRPLNPPYPAAYQIWLGYYESVPLSIYSRHQRCIIYLYL